MKRRTKLSLVNIKTAYRLGAIAYGAAVFFVSPVFLLALLPYGMFRLIAALEGYTKYDDWKRAAYGKADRNFTVRKLLYYIEKAEEVGIKNASAYNGSFYNGSIRVDEYTRIKLERETEKPYEASIYFDGNLIASTKKLSRQKINWNLKAFPELEKVLTKFLHNLDQEIEKAEKEKKKETIRKEKVVAQKKEQRQKELAREIRKAYKKDMSI